MSEADPRAELQELVHGFRTQIERLSRGGLYGAPDSPTPRPTAPAPAPAPEIEPEPAIDPAPGARPARAPAPLTLAQVREELGDCTRCKLHRGRKNIVFGVGDPEAALVFVGEAPGAEEDRRGEPFVGRAGQLLDRMIAAMGWTRDTVYICNTLKCRPPGNRDPQPDETSACRPFLEDQIGAIDPRVLVTLGRPAAQLLLETKAPISALRGRWKSFRGIPVMPTFHPAFLLRSPERKRDAWEDLKNVIAKLEELGVDPPGTPRT